MRLDYADVAAWREWLPLPPAIASGKGALRVWFEFAGGEAREIIADLELADVKARLGEELPELDLAHLSGRVGWRGDGAAARVLHAASSRSSTPTGAAARPDDVHARRCAMRPGRAADGRQLEFDRLQLEPLRDLAAHLPLPERWRADLARFAPRGTLTQRATALGRAGRRADDIRRAAAEFAKLGVVAQDAFPGRERPHRQLRRRRRQAAS